MKYLLVLMVLAVALWLWRHNRSANPRAPNPEQAKPTPRPPPTTMVRCQHCGTHVPQADAVQGRQGYYCDRTHQQRSEG